MQYVKNPKKINFSDGWSLFKTSGILKSNIALVLQTKNFSELSSNLNLHSQVSTFDELKDLADSQDNIAQYAIGFCYENGIGTIKSPKMAFYYYNLSAKNGYEKALFPLAICYENGLGCKKSIKTAISLYKEGSKSNPMSCWSALANIFEQGIGCEKSLKMANFYYSKNFKYLLKCEGDFDPVQFLIGNCYENGLGCEKSYEKAFYYYMIALNQGDKDAYLPIAMFYEKGVGCEKSIEKAIYYYELIAETGKFVGYMGLIVLLLEYRSNDYKLFFYLNKIIKEKINCNMSQLAFYEYQLADCYENGLGCEKSIKNAFYYYNLSAKHGNSAAFLALNEIYFHK